MSDWRPIETAPRTGEHILVAWANTSFGYIGGKQLPEFQTVAHWFNDGDGSDSGFYLSMGIVQDSYNDVPQHPTHWKALTCLSSRR
jgi:hypothetical protein